MDLKCQIEDIGMIRNENNKYIQNILQWNLWNIFFIFLMKVLVAVKRVVDSGIKVRVKPEGIDL